MAALLNTCTTIEQRGVVRFFVDKNMDAAKDIHKEMLPIWAFCVASGVRDKKDVRLEDYCKIINVFTVYFYQCP
jgi:hypothetical protein